MVNWERLLTDYSIEYITGGPNTKRGEISVQCPWCGDEDPSQHLGISLSKLAWGCHRDAQHRGKSSIRLIMALLNCSAAQARLLKAQYSQSDPDELEEALAMLINCDEPVAPEVTTEISFPPEFRSSLKWPDRFLKYLSSRGYKKPLDIASKYGLLCATTGRYKDRIIFPLYLNGLIGWTARAIINPVKAPRYLASSENAKMTCYGYPEAQSGGKALFIVEGPFDALRINSLEYRGCRAVALMGTGVTASQLCMIRSLMKKFERCWVFLDRDAVAQALELCNTIGNNMSYVSGWGNEKDAAEMDHEELIDKLYAATR